MTYTPIDFASLEAGRGLDAFVAEKLLGWSWEGEILRAPGLTQPASFYPNWELPDGRCHNGGLMEYSTEIAGAWALVEAMKRKWKHGEDGEPWAWSFTDLAEQGWDASVFWHHHDGHIPIADAQAPTLPLAICLVALKVWEEYEGRFEGQEPMPAEDVTYYANKTEPF